jgi:hypothetical protein
MAGRAPIRPQPAPPIDRPRPGRGSSTPADRTTRRGRRNLTACSPPPSRTSTAPASPARPAGTFAIRTIAWSRLNHRPGGSSALFSLTVTIRGGGIAVVSPDYSGPAPQDRRCGASVRLSRALPPERATGAHRPLSPTWAGTATGCRAGSPEGLGPEGGRDHACAPTRGDTSPGAASSMIAGPRSAKVFSVKPGSRGSSKASATAQSRSACRKVEDLRPGGWYTHALLPRLQK